MNSNSYALSVIADINPRRPRDLPVGKTDEVTFVPMQAVSERTACIQAPIDRPYGEVNRGFTYFEEDDVLLAKITPCMENGKSALARNLTNGFGFGSTEFHVLRARQRLVMPEYLHYFVRQQCFRDAARSRMRGAAGQQRVPKSFLDEVRVPLPPPSEQRRIVEILDQADALRKKRAEADKIADKLLPALFYKMFGDPATNPKGWDKVRLSDITTKITDGTHQPPPFEDSGIPFLFVQNIVSGIIDFRTRKFISPETYASLTARTKPERGDILYSTVGSYGVAVEVQTDREFAFQRHIGHIKPDHDSVNVSFLTAQLNTPFARAQADQRVRGVAQKTLNLSELRDFELLCPPIEEQERFARHVRTSALNAECRIESSSNLESLFSVLMHRAFSGDLTAKWREAHMKELLQEMELQATELGLKEVEA